MFVYVGGIPGAGKTTIIKKTIELSKKLGVKMKEAGGVSIMCKLANVSTTEKLRALPEKIRRKFRLKMELELLNIERQKPKTILIQDGHFVFFDIKGEKYGIRKIQPWDKDTILLMVVITADPKTILKRRLKDINHRPDRQCDLAFIKNEQELEIKIARSQAIKIGTKFCIVPNENKDIGKTSKLLLDYCLKQYLIKNSVSKI